MKIIKILNYIFPLIIGALCSYMGSLTHIGKNNILQIIMIFTLSVIFSILLFYDAKTELDKLQKSYHNNYSNIITKFLILKNIVIQLFAIIIGAVCSSLGNWDKNQSGFSIKSNILIILGIIYILFVIYSIYNDEKIDSNIKKYVSNIEMLNEIYENVQTSIVCINHAIIKELEKVQKNIYKVNIDTAGIEYSINRLCNELYNTIAKFDKGSFCVSYSKRIDQKFIMNIGYAGDNNIFHKNIVKRNIDIDNHLDSKIMKVNNKDIFIYCQKEDINKLFTYGKGYENRYNMYFAIPVYINDEIQGLFQITYFSESTLFNEKENIDFLINKIFPQYISITLLINEIYNSFRTMDQRLIQTPKISMPFFIMCFYKKGHHSLVICIGH